MSKRPRTKPYTAIGITRVPCSRCKAPSAHQWQICSDGNQWRGVCLACDVALNALVLEFMRIPGRQEKLRRYRRPR